MKAKVISMERLDLKIALIATSMKKMLRTRLLKKVMMVKTLMLTLILNGGKSIQTREVKMHHKIKKQEKKTMMSLKKNLKMMPMMMRMTMMRRMKSERQIIKEPKLNK